MARRGTLYLPVMIAAAVLVACSLALLALSGEAGAAFPGKNGRIAYNAGGVIYTINPDGSGKSKVTEGGDDPDYSPDGKKIVYYTGSHLRNPDVYTIDVGGGGKSKVAEGWTPSWGPRP